MGVGFDTGQALVVEKIRIANCHAECNELSERSERSHTPNKSGA